MIKVNSGQIVAGVMRYAERELLPQYVGNSVAAVGMRAAAHMARQNPTKIRAMVDESAIMQLFCMGGGFYDVDAMAETIKAGMTEEGLLFKLPVVGSIKLKHDDIDRLRMDIDQAESI